MNRWPPRPVQSCQFQMVAGASPVLLYVFSLQITLIFCSDFSSFVFSLFNPISSCLKADVCSYFTRGVKGIRLDIHEITHISILQLLPFGFKERDSPPLRPSFYPGSLLPSQDFYLTILLNPVSLSLFLSLSFSLSPTSFPIF